MKVVLFCGGMGMRLREYSDKVPKPMVPIGYRPVLWHVMKYYAHYGHKDFILCLGYRADVIKDYFRNYDETITNDFVVRAGKGVELLGSDARDWNITLIDTGLSANIGQRLVAARRYLNPGEMFLANYSDGLTDAPLDRIVKRFEASDKTACFLAVRPTFSYHLIDMDKQGEVVDIRHSGEVDLRINGGFFVLRPEIFDVMQPGEDLVPDPLSRLLQAGKLMAHRHDGFWAAMDTFKDRQMLEDLHGRGQAPWQVWATESESC